MLKYLFILVAATGVWSMPAQAQCNPSVPITLINTQPCTICFTLIEMDSNCIACPPVTICVPPGGIIPVPPSCGGTFETVTAHIPPAPCAATGNAPWACCLPAGPPVVPFAPCNPCGGGGVATMTWGGGPAAPTLTV